MFHRIHFHPHIDQNLIHLTYLMFIDLDYKTHVHYGNHHQLLIMYLAMKNYFQRLEHFSSFNGAFACF